MWKKDEDQIWQGDEDSFWETGIAMDESYSTVVARVRARTEREPPRRAFSCTWLVAGAWTLALGPWVARRAKEPSGGRHAG